MENRLAKNLAKKKKKPNYRQGEAKQADAGIAAPWWETDSNELWRQEFHNAGLWIDYFTSVQSQKIIWNTRDLQREMRKH